MWTTLLDSRFTIDGKLMLVAGGSKGLGKETAIRLFARGANVIIIARGQEGLDAAKVEIEQARVSEQQVVQTLALDLIDANKVDIAVRQLPSLPDALFCVAGGTSTQLGFFINLEPKHITSCMEENYYTAVFVAQSVLRLWVEKGPCSAASPRHIVFTSSTAAFVGLPGYVAYTPTKTAVRALADTLRQEVLLYGGKDLYQIHCFFPGTFVSDSFIAEQAIKPELTKQLEGTADTNENLYRTKDTCAAVTEKLLDGLQAGRFLITTDLEGSLLLNNMRGPSPRDMGLWDFCLGLIAAVAWAFYRRLFDRKTVQYRKKTS